MGYILLRTAGERLADGGVRCCVIRQLDILKLFLMQVVRTDAYAPIRHRGSVVAWQDTVSCHCWFMGKKGYEYLSCLYKSSSLAVSPARLAHRISYSLTILLVVSLCTLTYHRNSITLTYSSGFPLNYEALYNYGCTAVAFYRNTGRGGAC